MKKLSTIIPVFLLTFFLLSSTYYYWFVPKITTVEFKIECDKTDNVEVFYDLGNGWHSQQMARQINNPLKISFHKFEFELLDYPSKLRLDFGTEKDSITLSNIKIYNSQGYKVDLENTIIRPNDLEWFDLKSNNKIDLISSNGDPYLVVNTSFRNSLSQVVESVPAFVFLIICILSISFSIFLFKKKKFQFSSKNLFTIVFLLLIFNGILDQITHFVPKFNSEENRALAPLPSSPILANYIVQLDAYLNDHFTFKQIFTYFDSQAKYELYGVSSQPNKTVIGKDDNFFPVELEILEDYRREVHFTENQLMAIKIILEQRRDWLEKRNIPFVLAFTPNKQTHLSELMPREFLVGRSITRMEQLYNFLKANSDIEFIDLKETLENKKQKGFPLFYKHDMHWNNLGAFYGYQKIMQECSNYFPKLKANSVSDFDTSTTYISEGDQVKMLLLHHKLPKREVKFERIEKVRNIKTVHKLGGINDEQHHVEDQGIKLIMFHDSYGVNLIPFISRHFEESIFIWDHRFHDKLIEEKKPDIVIHEMAELFITNLLFPNSAELIEEVGK